MGSLVPKAPEPLALRTRNVPPPLALHPNLDLCGLRVLYRQTPLARGAYNSFQVRVWVLSGANKKRLHRVSPGSRKPKHGKKQWMQHPKTPQHDCRSTLECCRPGFFLASLFCLAFQAVWGPENLRNGQRLPGRYCLRHARSCSPEGTCLADVHTVTLNPKWDSQSSVAQHRSGLGAARKLETVGAVRKPLETVWLCKGFNCLRDDQKGFRNSLGGSPEKT